MRDAFRRVCEGAESEGLKCRHCQEADILQVFGEDATPLDRARHGLLDVEELAHATAEHHPHWRMLNYVAEAGRIVLDRWDGDIAPDDMEQLEWAVAGLRDSLEREPRHK